jgi:hypothetical protein
MSATPVGLASDTAQAVVAFAELQSKWLASPRLRPRTLTVRVEPQSSPDPKGERVATWTRDLRGDVVSLVIKTRREGDGGAQ